MKGKSPKEIERVKKTYRRSVMTKRKTSLAKRGPREEAFGKLKGTFHVKGNLINPIEKAWDADS